MHIIVEFFFDKILYKNYKNIILIKSTHINKYKFGCWDMSARERKR